MKKKFSAGFVVGILAAAAAVAGAVLNQSVSGSVVAVTVLLVIGAILEIVGGVMATSNELGNGLSVVTSILFTAAMAAAFFPQINQIASVVSGLDPMDVLKPFITFCVANGVAMVLSVVGGFVGKAK